MHIDTYEIKNLNALQKWSSTYNTDQVPTINITLNMSLIDNSLIIKGKS